MTATYPIRQFLALLLVLTVGLQSFSMAGGSKCFSNKTSTHSCCNSTGDSKSCCIDLSTCHCGSKNQDNNRGQLEFCQCDSSQPLPVTPAEGESVNVTRLLLSSSSFVSLVCDVADPTQRSHAVSLLLRPAPGSSLKSELCVWQT